MPISLMIDTHVSCQLASSMYVSCMCHSATTVCRSVSSRTAPRLSPMAMTGMLSPMAMKEFVVGAKPDPGGAGTTSALCSPEFVSQTHTRPLSSMATVCLPAALTAWKRGAACPQAKSASGDGLCCITIRTEAGAMICGSAAVEHGMGRPITWMCDSWAGSAASSMRKASVRRPSRLCSGACSTPSRCSAAAAARSTQCSVPSSSTPARYSLHWPPAAACSPTTHKLQTQSIASIWYSTCAPLETATTADAAFAPSSSWHPPGGL